MVSDPERIIEAYDSGRIRKILLTRISRLGDLVFTTPAVRCLKARFPRAELHYLTNAYSASALQNSPHIARIHLMDRKSFLWRFLRTSPALRGLREEHFDLAIPFRWREEYLTLFRKIKVPRYFKLASTPELPEEMHQADRYLAQLKPLGVEPDEKGMEVFPGREDDAAVLSFLEEMNLADSPLVVLHPGCHQIIRGGTVTGAAKRVWPADRWATLVEAIHHGLGVPPVLTAASRGDMEYDQEIIRASAVPCPIFSQETTGRFAALFKKAGVFVCGDTGPLHVASAVGVPTVALFGASHPALTGPYRNPGGSRTIQKDLHCSPCKGKKIKCTFNECMRLISPMEVYDALLELMPIAGGESRSQRD